jgi:hypothetical protein
MPDVREVYEMVTKQKPPQPGALERQQKRQVRMARNRKVGAIAVAATIGFIAFVMVFQARDGGSGTQPAGEPTQTTVPVQSLRGGPGPLEPGTYAISTLDPDLDASHTITIDVPDGYEAFNESVVFSQGPADTGVGLWGVGWFFADACKWRGTQSATSSTDDVVAALTGQKGLRASTPADVTIDGYVGTYLEVTVASQAKLDRCDDGRFTAFALAGETATGQRHLERVGQPELLWILDVDGHPLVIDVLATDEERAELGQLVESIKIDPVA